MKWKLTLVAFSMLQDHQEFPRAQHQDAFFLNQTLKRGGRIDQASVEKDPARGSPAALLCTRMIGAAESSSPGPKFSTSSRLVLLGCPRRCISGSVRDKRERLLQHPIKTHGVLPTIATRIGRFDFAQQKSLARKSEG